MAMVLTPGNNLKATFVDAAGKEVTGGQVTWHTDNSPLVTLSSTGSNTASVTPVGVGTVNVTADYLNPDGTVVTTPGFTLTVADDAQGSGMAVSGVISAV